MAKKLKEKKKNKGESKKLYRGVKRDFNQGNKIVGELGLDQPLSRLDESLIAPLADPRSSAYAGNRSDETKWSIEALQKQVENSGKRSEEMKKVLGLMEQGLAGLSSQENQALREQAAREVDREYQNAVRQLSQAQAKRNVFGASATAQMRNLNKDRMDTQSKMEQDLLVKNIDIQDRRRGEYAQTLGGQEQSEWQRTADSLTAYGQGTQQAEADEWSRAMDARNELNDVRKTNLDQEAKDRAAKIGLITGVVNYGQAKKTGKRNYDLAKEGLAVQREGIAAGAQANADYINAMNNIHKDQFGEEPNV